MIEKVHTLWPEIALFVGACIVMVLGLSRSLSVRRLAMPLSLAALGVAGVLAYTTTPLADAMPMPHMPLYVKVLTCVIGALLVLVLAGTPDRQYEQQVAWGLAVFDPIRTTRAEFYAFFLFSLTGVMLCAGATDLIWLFLALELTSLPTYVMVVISSQRNRSMEAGVKYFFLGALGAATFLMGFALLYGATGSTRLPEIGAALEAQFRAGGLNPIAVAALVLSILGIGFKIAAVPMHFYTADVYQGASAPMAAMLAFVPKTAGFIALLLLCSAVGWYRGQDPGVSLPEPVHAVLWIMAAVTMTVGNVLAVMQHSLKRILAYSSIAHSGYMLVGVLSGPGPAGATFGQSGVSAVLFYLMAYGVMNLGAFAVIGSLERRAHARTGEGEAAEPREVDDLDDVRGLCTTRPLLGWVLVLSAVGLLGLPPLLGFWGKLPLFTAGIASGDYALVVILGLNSAIAAYYYLRIVNVALLEAPDLAARGSEVQPAPFVTRVLAGVASAAGVIVLSLVPLTGAAHTAGQYNRDTTAPRVQPGGAKPDTQAAAPTVEQPRV